MNGLRTELAERIAARNVLVVVGTGVSLAATGGEQLASWKELISNGVEKCAALGLRDADWVISQKQLLEGDIHDLLGVAEQVSGRLGWRPTPPCEGYWSAWLRRTVGTLRARQPELIEAIRDLGAPIATLNYDNLLTEVTDRRPITWQQAERWLPVLQDDDEAILHLHGHWDQPSSVVLGIRSYILMMGRELAQHLQRALASLRSLVFIGCSGTLEDPNFQALIAWMRDQLHGAEHSHYLLLPESEPLQVEDSLLRGAGIVPLRYGNEHADLLPFIRDLAPGGVGGRLGKPPAMVCRRPAIHVGDISDAVERPDEMNWLRRQLLTTVPHAHSTYVVLCGEPGIGKTFLAEYFAREHFEKNYISVFVGQEPPESAASDICRRLGGGGYPMPSTTHAIELMEARLRGGLLILDNVEDSSIRSLIPSAAVKSILTTTNSRVAGDIAGAGNARYIGEFSSSQSVALFQKYRRFEGQDEDALVELSRRLGNLPLAVAMAAQYLRYHEAERPGHLLDNDVNIEPLHKKLTSLFYKNFMQLGGAAQTILVRISFFSEAGADSDLLMTMFRYQPAGFWKHVYDAKATSLLHIVPSSARYLLKCHPLVRKFLQARDISGTHQKEFLEAISREFRVRSPETIDYALIEQIRLLDAVIMATHLKECTILLLEVNEALKRTRFSVIESFDRLFSRGGTALQGDMQYRDLCVAAAEEARRLNLLSKERKYLDLVGERI